MRRDTPIAASQDTKIFLYFGVLCPYKGVEDLLSAWRQAGAATNGAKLLIAGQPNPESYLDIISEQAAGMLNVDFRPRVHSG